MFLLMFSIVWSLVVKSLTGYPSCAVAKTSGRNLVGIAFMFPWRIAASLVFKLFKASFIICFFSSGCNDPFLMSSSITFKTKILNYTSIPLKLCTRLILEYWHCSCICYFRYAVYCYLSSFYLQFGVLLILWCCIGRGCLEPYLGGVVVLSSHRALKLKPRRQDLDFATLNGNNHHCELSNATNGSWSITIVNLVPYKYTFLLWIPVNKARDSPPAFP